MSAKENEERAWAAWQAAEDAEEQLRQEINTIVTTSDRGTDETLVVAQYDERIVLYRDARERTKQSFDAWSKAWDEWRAEDR